MREDEGFWMTKRRCAAVLAAGLAMTPAVLLAQSGYLMAVGMSVHGSQGYLGVDIRDISDEQASALKLRDARGAEIVRVDHDGPAGKSGLHEHDVILQVNGQVVEGGEQLRRMLREIPAGHTINLVISRDGQQQTVSSKMANREELERQAWEQHLVVPEPDGGVGAPAPQTASGAPGGSGSASSPPRGGMGFFHGSGPGSRPGGEHGFMGTMLGAPYTGATLQPIGAQLAEFFGVQGGGAGLLVQSVEANSPAATAGLRAGDVVVKLNQAAVTNIGDWSRTVHENKGKPVPVTVLREKREQTLTLTPDPKRRSDLVWPELWPGFAGVDLPDDAGLLAELRPIPGGPAGMLPGFSADGFDSPEFRREMEQLRKSMDAMRASMGDLLE